MDAFYGYCGMEGILGEYNVHGNNSWLIDLNEQNVYPATLTQAIWCQTLFSPASDEFILRIVLK